MTNDEKRASVIKWAESQLGVIEWPSGSNKVKYNDWYYGKTGAAGAWCMAEVQWVFERADLPLPVKTASCTSLASYAKQHGQWVTNGFEPGDILFMHWGKDKAVTEHVGIVKEVKGKYVVTYEGNTSLVSQANGGCVMERNRAYANITGAYRPWYNV
ncbi:CHAP domain-containing protein [Oscillibacter sp.]|uniref:CHAP domain-containing protein n=1 Tax=Oscillibacter sp. TaxID=1945593 RepID=UPI00339B4568